MVNPERGIESTSTTIIVAITFGTVMTVGFHLYLWWIGAYKDLYDWLLKHICCCCRPKKILPAINYHHTEIPVKVKKKKKVRRPPKKNKKEDKGIPTGHEVGEAWNMKKSGQDEWTKKIAEAGAAYKNGSGMGHEQASGPGD